MAQFRLLAIDSAQIFSQRLSRQIREISFQERFSMHRTWVDVRDIGRSVTKGQKMLKSMEEANARR